MHNDTLKTDIFTDKRGKNYRCAEELDKEMVARFFKKQGFNVLAIDQIFRHVHGKLEKNGQTLFFKLASTKDISERTYNEMVWNNKITERTTNSYIRAYFCVPQIFDWGNLGENFYYISEFFEGSVLTTKKPPDQRNLAEWIDRIVEVNMFLLNLKGSLFLPRDKNEFKGRVNFFKLFSDQDWKLLQELKEFDLNDVLEREKELRFTYEPGINHGGFTPWHIIENGNAFVLIDGEHASCKLPKYFDIVYFYHRVYTGAGAPEIAKNYMNKIRNGLNSKERDKFDQAINPLIANRIIGGFWDAKNEKKRDFLYHLSLKKDFLENELF